MAHRRLDLRVRPGQHLDDITDRDRKLLLKRSEIDSLDAKVREKGLTPVPTKLYFVKDGQGQAQVALGLEGQGPER